jgi:hypothetical protein
MNDAVVCESNGSLLLARVAQAEISEKSCLQWLFTAKI